MQELLEVRDFMNEGGRVLYTGQRAGQQYTTASGRSSTTRSRTPVQSDPAIEARCLPLHGSGDSQGDPIEYWFGAAVTTPDGGLDPDTGDPFAIAGLADPLAGLTSSRNGADSAQNQASDSSFIATEDFLAVTDPAASFPQFESEVVGRVPERHRRPVRSPHRSAFMWSQRADEAYKRLSRTITSRPAERRCRSGRATTSSWTSTT